MNQGLALRYLDEESEYVLFSSESEYQIALEYCVFNDKLKVIIYLVDSPEILLPVSYPVIPPVDVESKESLKVQGNSLQTEYITRKLQMLKLAAPVTVPKTHGMACEGINKDISQRKNIKQYVIGWRIKYTNWLLVY